MIRLSKIVLSSHWIAYSPWVTLNCLGFHLIAAPVVAQPVAQPLAHPIPSALESSESALSETAPANIPSGSTLPVLIASQDTRPLPQLSSRTKEHSSQPAELSRPHFMNGNSSGTVAETASNTNTNIVHSASEVELSTRIADARNTDARNPTDGGASSTTTSTTRSTANVTPARISQATPSPLRPSVAVSNTQCLADCNPTDRFDFSPPNIAIPPRSLPSYERPAVAGTPVVPVPGYPTTAEGTLPPPPPSFAAERPAPQPSRSTAIRPAPISGTETFGTVPASPVPSPTVAASSYNPRRPLTPPALQFQGVYIYQGGEDSARARVTGLYPILPELQVGGSLDFAFGNIFTERGDDGVVVNELYVAAAIPDYPNLRFVAGQMDLTSYFDRNSFAKDSATHFFNPVFATNPALSAAGVGSRQGALVNWTIVDEVEVKAAVFSSDRSISAFEVDAFAGEVGARLGNFVVRGTYVTAEDAGASTSFEESFRLERDNGRFGPQDGDREDAYGVNAEFFVPEISMGVFARYGWYNNRDLDRSASTYSVGINLLDLFLESDRLGLAYGRTLSNDDLRDGDNPDVFEAFYDFRVLSGLRLGFTFQGLDEFSETIGGVRVRTDFDLVPRRTQ